MCYVFFFFVYMYSITLLVKKQQQIDELSGMFFFRVKQFILVYFKNKMFENKLKSIVSAV